MRLTRPVYRSHNPRWSWDPESGRGATLEGGRFNPRGMPALYTSLRQETAWLESQQGFAYKTQPMLICSYDVDCDDMLDLTDPAVLSANGIAGSDLSCAWKDMETRGLMPPSWAMSNRLMAAGIAGIIVRSFAFGASIHDINAVFWRWEHTPPHQVVVVDDLGRLPKNASSWV